MNVIPSVFHQSAWYLAGPGGYCGEPDPSDTMAIPAVSQYLVGPGAVQERP